MGINTNSWNRIRYTLYAPVYNVISTFFHSFRARSVESLDLKPGDKVLIQGAGTGLDLEFFPRGTEIHAIDITPSMITQLKREAEKLYMNVQAEVMDAGNLNYEDESFDAVVLHLIVAVIPDPVACLRETERVLKPGGKFTIMDKFIDPGSTPGILRRTLNLFTNVIATDVNRDIDELLSHTGLQKTKDEKLRSIFRLIFGIKPEA